MSTQPESPPILSAVSSSARQLFLLLRCIGFGSKAQVQPTEDGIRFSVEESSVMEGMAFLGKTLFSSFQFTPPQVQPDTVDTTQESGDVDPFSISLAALLETLQIFGLSELSKPTPWNRDPYNRDAFSAQALGLSGICRLRYDSVGSPLVIILEEAGISTTCKLVTYEPAYDSDIPFARLELGMKIIMQASYLADAITELSTSNPEHLTIRATDTFLILSASGDHGSAVVQFHRDNKAVQENDALAAGPNAVPKRNRGILETFQVSGESFSQSYKFSHISNTKKALQSAIKVSIRGDSQGVLSLQFMIENLEGGGVSFVDYRFIPLVRDEGYEEDEELGDIGAPES
ncbi:Rad1-domain-containing protein [Microthyrium microscopicum]|uniref:Rad1-domain-containing protein n=1 Tax=Microthyrium microscopicum TaxID=703497 RepID=A0A6A6TVU4_9PEZI|nr:Rad1-domain-containing protein [Microthyrium microscopicum]